jgi:hypothetical protein
MIETIITSLLTALLASGGALIVASRQMKREFRLHFQAETLVCKLLRHPSMSFRSFDMIKHHIGGFEDDDLRKILVQAGALRFRSTEGVELWGLFDRVGGNLINGYPELNMNVQRPLPEFKTGSLNSRAP